MMPGGLKYIGKRTLGWEQPSRAPMADAATPMPTSRRCTAAVYLLRKARVIAELLGGALVENEEVRAGVHASANVWRRQNQRVARRGHDDGVLARDVILGIARVRVRRPRRRGARRLLTDARPSVRYALPVPTPAASCELFSTSMSRNVAGVAAVLAAAWGVGCGARTSLEVGETGTNAGSRDSGKVDGDSGEGASCRPAEILCSGSCVDEQTDPNNCGGCGLVCEVPCKAGHCLVTLASDQHPIAIAVDSKASTGRTVKGAVRMKISGS
jgi:hypothetical protein